MKTMAAAILLLCFLIPASVVLSQGRPSTDFLVLENAIHIDGHRFDKVSPVPGFESIRNAALSLVRRRGYGDKRVSLTLDRRYPALPTELRPAHSMNFTAGAVPNEIRTGAFTGSRADEIFRRSKGWDYHETDSRIALGIAIKNQEGRKSIVLIDRSRKTFLSISN